MKSLILLSVLLLQPAKPASDWDWDRYLDTKAKATKEGKSFVVVVGYFAFPRIDGITYVQVGSFPSVSGDGLVVARWDGKEHSRIDLPANATMDKLKAALRVGEGSGGTIAPPPPITPMIWQGRSC